METTRWLPYIPFILSCSYNRIPELPRTAQASIQFMGNLGKPALDDFYRKSSLVVWPTGTSKASP